MAKAEKVNVPDIGGAENVDVIEVLVNPGDRVAVEDSLITLEGDKATMEIPSPLAGVIEDIHVKVGDKVSEGSLILTIKTEDKSAEKSETKKSEKEEFVQTKKEKKAKNEEVSVPDIGGAKDVDVIEVSVKAGDDVNVEDTLIILEGEKATMEIPSPYAGKVVEVKSKVGDKVSEGDLILTLKTSGEDETAEEEKTQKKPEEEKSKEIQKEKEKTEESREKFTKEIHAGPAVRRLAHEIGIDLQEIKGSGEKGRIVKEDVKNYVQARMKGGVSAGGLALPPAPKVDFAKFGEIEKQPLSKIKKISGVNLARNWVTIPHVSQFGEADITEMERFRKELKGRAEEQGFKLTPLVFIMKAVVSALREYPIFNASLDQSGETLILKKYFHVGVAVDTPNGLVVPVIRDVDKKGLFDLAQELAAISEKARTKGLGLADMQGGSFTISSLGGIGGTAFTPIINAPEVAILGISRSFMKPVYQKSGEFVPRLTLPLSLSYDHRVIDGADGARFIVTLANRLSDIRTLLL